MLKVLRLPSVKETTGLSKSTIYREMKKGAFPQSIKLTENTVGWLSEEIQAYIKSRKRNTRVCKH